jgi:HTH-type transcriptional regulator, cell division transcriptional repressor
MTLGDRIRQAREQADISQAELARRIGISKNAMNTIEGGQSDPRVSRIVAIARVLGVSTDTLLDMQEKPPATRQRTRKAPVA